MTASPNKYAGLYNDCGIFEMWHDKTWDDFVDPDYKRVIQKYVAEQTKKNVILYGDNGTGKSMLMNLAMKDLLHKKQTVYVIDFRNLIKEYLKSWRNEGKLGAIMMVDYLCIDDLGKEYSSGDVSKELAVTTLDYVLRYRFQRQLSTWMTFNMKLGEVEGEYGVHINSLLKRTSEAVVFEGEDFGNKLFKTINPKKK